MDFRVVISLRGFLFHVCYIALNKGYYGTCQYNLLDRMLQHDLNATLNQGYVIFITFVSIISEQRISISQSIHYCESSPWKILYVSLFLTFVCLTAFFFSMLLLVCIFFLFFFYQCFVIENFTLSSLLSLLLVLLFLLLLLIVLYLFVIVSFSQCCYSCQVNIAVIVSFVNILI